MVRSRCHEVAGVALLPPAALEEEHNKQVFRKILFVESPDACWAPETVRTPVGLLLEALGPSLHAPLGSRQQLSRALSSI